MKSPTKTKINLVYIAGYGHSGSTILDIALGTHSEITSLGEFNNFSEWVMENDPCSCGRLINECKFWKPILDKVPRSRSATVSFGLTKRSQLRHLFRAISKRFLDTGEQDIAELNHEILDKLHTEAHTLYAVDSSKSFGRLLALSRSGLFNLKIIHLIRDGRGVVYSMQKSKAITMERHYQFQKRRPSGYVARRWLVTNLVIFICHFLLFRDNYMLVNYEDFAAQPDAVLKTIHKFLGIQPERLKDQIQVSHNVGGNDLRLKPIRSIKIDLEWKNSLAYKDLIWFNINGGFIANLFRYRIRPKYSSTKLI